MYKQIGRYIEASEWERLLIGGCNNISEMEVHCVSIKNEHEAGTMYFKGALTHFFASRQ
jgi:hypothetical protein